MSFLDEPKIIPNSEIKVRKIKLDFKSIKYQFIIHEADDKEIRLEIEKTNKLYYFKVINAIDSQSFGRKVHHKYNLNVEVSTRDNKIINRLEEATELSKKRLTDDLSKIGTYIEDTNLFEIETSKKYIDEELDSTSSSKGRYGIRNYYAAELISLYFREIEDNGIIDELYKLLAKYFKESNIEEKRAISFLKLVMRLSKHNIDCFISGIEDIYKDDSEVSKRNFKEFESILTGPKFIEAPNYQIRDDLHQAMKLVNPKHIWFKLEYDNSHSYHLEASKDVENEFTVKRVDGRDYYYFDEEFKRYELLNAPSLGVLVRSNHSVSLKNHQFDSIISGIQRDDFCNPYLWNFQNGIYDIARHEIISTDNKEHFTIKNAGVLNKVSKQLTSLNYDKSTKIEPNFNMDKISFVQKTIQEILIPKYDKNSTDLYYDFLQRVGASFLPVNEHKAITMYWGDGDNGKTKLTDILECIFNKNHSAITTNEITQSFSKDSSLKEKNVIVLDELDKNSFKGIESDLKRLCGAGGSVKERKMYSTDTTDSNEFGIIWCGTNKIPDFDHGDTAFLRRLDILKLPNQFVNKEEDLEENQYPIIDNLDQMIENDIEGLTWLASAGLIAYKSMLSNKENFKCKQSPTETHQIAVDGDPLENFLINYLEYGEHDYHKITNKEIREKAEKYFAKNDIDYDCDSRGFAIQIGIKMNSLFPNSKKIKSSDFTGYKNIRFKLGISDF